MKVGAKVDIFNYRMRERRAELGVTQEALYRLSGVRIESIVAIEKLRDVCGRIGEVEEKLHRIATALDVDFEELFPQDYLNMLAEKKLPKRRLPFIWCKDISLEQLTSIEPGLLLPSPEEILFDDPEKNGLNEQIRSIIQELPQREREVVEMRFGLKDGQAHTLEEVASSSLAIQHAASKSAMDRGQ